MPEQNKPLFDDDILYHSGTEEKTASLQREFVRHFLHAPGKVLEVGCGKGVLLSLLKEAGIEAYGIDLSPSVVEYCRSKGLEAHHADVLAHVKKLPSESLGGIFCAHVIEHMQPTDVIELLRESFRILKKGSKLVIITPNTKDLRTTERFWLDVTHVRPYPEKLLRLLLQKEGFVRVKSTTGKEPADNIVVRLAKTFLRIWFMGFMFTGDLVVIAEK